MDNTLLDIGFIRYSVDIRIGDHVWDEEEKLITAQPPMFMIHAQKIIDENDKGNNVKPLFTVIPTLLLTLALACVFPAFANQSNNILIYA